MDRDDLPEPAKRALAEAEERRKKREADLARLNLPPEEGAPASVKEGVEPTRYGDWEKAGRAIDFS
ncbi:MAG: DUF1674 domain-containing protein [Pseudomonadota bacterium]